MNEACYFEYGEKEILYLKSRDKTLGFAIEKIGHINRAVIPDMFSALINSIIGQQISTKAHATIWERLLEKHSPVTPENIAIVPVEQIQKLGTTMRKAEYIKDLADKVYNGDLNLVEISALPDEQVISRLCEIKGIGVWTAEMLLIFSMQRPNVLSYGDLAILRGMRMLYRHRKITPELFAKYKKRYAPYASVASLYLWAIAGGEFEGFSDPSPKKT